MALYQVVEQNGQKSLIDVASGGSSGSGGGGMPNTETWITESGNYTIPCDGYYFIELYPGGDGAYWVKARKWGAGGRGYAPTQILAYYNAGTVIPVVIGAGGQTVIDTDAVDYAQILYGGVTKFGNYTCDKNKTRYNVPLLGVGTTGPSTNGVWLSASGVGGAVTAGGNYPAGPYTYGAGGGLCYLAEDNVPAVNANQGAVRLLYYDPNKTSTD